MEQKHEQLEIGDALHHYWSNKRILITGGSAGLGRGLAKFLCSVGAQVAVVGRNQKKLERLKTENSSIITIQADISIKEDIHRIVGEVVGQFGEPIDIVINNASTLGMVPLRNLLDTPCEKFSEALETNLLGPFRLIKAVLPAMLLRESGLIVNLSSDASVTAYPTWGIYSVSKAALDHLTAIWSKELPKIAFVSIDPGDMFTEMHLQADSEADKELLYDPDQVAQDISKFLALGSNKFPKTRFSASEWRKYLK